MTDISELNIVFEDAAHLLEGLERLMDRFNVLWVRNGFRHPSDLQGNAYDFLDQFKVSIGIKQQVPQVHISEVHLYIRPEPWMAPENSCNVESVLKESTFEVSHEDMEGILRIVQRTMYTTDGLLIHHAVHEVERLQAALAKVGIRSKEYR